VHSGTPAHLGTHSSVYFGRAVCGSIAKTPSSPRTVRRSTVGATRSPLAMDRVLYFPYINVPRSEWFTRVLLYWDSIGCILPEESQPYERGRVRQHHHPDRSWEFTQELLSEGLLEPIYPDQAFGRDFMDGFMRLLEPLETRERGRLDLRTA